MSSTDRKTIFNNLVTFYNQLYPHLNGKDNQRYVADEWKIIKEIRDENEFFNAVSAKKREWKSRLDGERKKNCQSFFAESKVKSIPQHSSDLQEQDLYEISISSSPSSLPLSTPTSPSSTNSSMNEPTPVSSPSSSSVSSKKVREKPRQVQLRADIALEKDILLALHRKRDSAMLTEADRKELKSRGKNLIDHEKKLKAAMENKRKQQNYRNNHKRRIESLDDETRKKVKGKIVTKGGQPSKYDEDLLISVILKDCYFRKCSP